MHNRALKVVVHEPAVRPTPYVCISVCVCVCMYVCEYGLPSLHSHLEAETTAMINVNQNPKNTDMHISLRA
jgi:hypothetical protein